MIENKHQPNSQDNLITQNIEETARILTEEFEHTDYFLIQNTDHKGYHKNIKVRPKGKIKIRESSFFFHQFLEMGHTTIRNQT